ncbi:diaminopimelate decarboxylase [Enterococcus dispar]|uniref:diaminopimelate decarboxylase n=1 Tax=Enterococcus dispar TaxID=44009 RepID=UPI00189D5416|nr:diaminopimelate decarboxylase [Enterococcus dispar]
MRKVREEMFPQQNKNGHLYWGNCDTVALAQKYGTPLYVYDENLILKECQALKDDFLDKYPNTRVAYASKAFNTIAMLQLIKDAGLSLDVVSGGELYTAIAADFPAARIEFNGNNKSVAELEMAIDYGVGRIIVDSLQEVALIQQICQQLGKKAHIMFRITPEVDVKTHAFISTGQKDSKFGIPLEPAVLYPQIEKVFQAENLEFYGFHFHVGSQLSDNAAHLAATQVALNLMLEVKKRYNYQVKELNFGGGFGVCYIKEDIRQPYRYFLDPMMELTAAFCLENDLVRPEIVIEPGRSIVAEAGITLHTIGAIKELPALRKYVSIDGGMTDNIRPGLYHAQYTGVVANKVDEKPTQKVTISGKACESTDLLIKDLPVPDVCAGDIFATFTTGAYGYSMASNYNKLPIPAVIFTKDGQAEVVVKRQTYAQMIQNEVKR